jgi:hypothetical protein
MNYGQWQLQVFSLPGKELASFGIHITELNSDGYFLSGHAAGRMVWTYSDNKVTKMVGFIIKNIADKNLCNTYTPKRENVIRINYTDPQIVRSLMNKTITNLMIS